MSNSNGETILVTGGCGYIGSHTIVCLLGQGYNVVVVDNLANSSNASLDRVSEICNLTPEERQQRLVFYNIDLCDQEALRRVFQDSPKFQACIHFAGLKAVGESTKIPLKYYHNNLTGTFFLLELMDEFGCHSIVFSSSATVYGAADTMPITESTTVGTGITNAYGRTKYMIEEILKDFYNSKVLGDTTNDWSVVILRYFNPVGSHPSGKIGEDPQGIPNNLMPYVAQVAIGRREFLTVFGSDYPTPDGTGVRDYIHVMDLAEAHAVALQHLLAQSSSTQLTLNIGTGRGLSVLEVVRGFEQATGLTIPFEVVERRPGDVPRLEACPRQADAVLGWTAKRSLNDMCRDGWAWQKANPAGYRTTE